MMDCIPNRLFPDPFEVYRPWRDEEHLREVYHDRQLSTQEVADVMECSRACIMKWMDKLDIERRSFGEHQTPVNLRSEEYVKQVWCEEELSVAEIAEENDCTKRTVSEVVDRFDLPRRIRETPRTLQSVVAVDDLFNNRGLTCSEIASFCGCGPESVRRSLIRHEIDYEYERPSGEDHYNWKGGWSSYYGPHWDTRRKEVLERDGRCCQRCGMSGEEHHVLWERTLPVHHITPHRTFETNEEANQHKNLITLCMDCHNTMEGLPIDNRHNAMDSRKSDVVSCD